MANIIPFRAIRAPRHLAHLVVTRPYYTYAKHVMDAKLESNKFSFLHIINPEFGLSDRHAPNSTERFSRVFDKFNEFIREGYLIQDIKPNFYIYRQTRGLKSYTGLICGADVREYDNDLIKKHESTITSREEVFVKYLEITGFNAEPVLLSHKPNPDLRHLLQSLTQERPEYEFATTDDLKHELWVLPANKESEISDHYAQLDSLYIADGHHRTASSSRLAALKRDQGCDECDPSQFFLCYIIDEDELDIFPFHRVVKDAGNLSQDDFFAKLNESFELATTEIDLPENHNSLILVKGQERFLLTVKPGKVDFSHPIQCLSTQYLTDLILEPLLGIFDQKTSDRIEFVSGFQGIGPTLKKLEKYPDGLAFILYPTSMSQVRKVADEKLIMPPKSTWVEPKLRSGMTIYSFENDRSES
jgi:uncharacterized protein (DUF1015 family)